VLTTALAQVQQSYQLQTTQGWNLLGNSIDKSINVATMFGDTSKVTSVWKWDNAGNKWLFYAPSLSAAEHQSYTSSKGFGLLTSIEGGEGYWVNAKVATDYGTQTGLGVISPKIGAGWNLVASGGTADSKDVSVEMFSHISKKTIDVASVWQWAGTKWNFYAPSLVLDGTLSSYQSSNNYGAFVGSISGAGKGFWVKGDAAKTVTPKVVFKTSYENKNNIDIAKTSMPLLKLMGITPILQDEEGNSDRSLTFGDFTQDGKYTAFVSANRATGKYGVPHIGDADGVAYFLQQNDKGEWVDITKRLLNSVEDRMTCITPSFSLTADLNNDGRPDVYMACHGVDYDLTKIPGVNFAETQVVHQVMFLSQANGTYKKVIPDYNIYGHKAAIADLNEDGNADIITVDPYNQNSGLPFVLWGNGDGTFRRDNSVFTNTLWNYTSRNDSGVWNVELIPVNGKINLLLIGFKKTLIINDIASSVRNGINYATAIAIDTPKYTNGESYSLIIDTVYINNHYYFDATIYSMVSTGDMVISIFKYDLAGNYKSTVYNFINSHSNWAPFIAQIKPQNGMFIAYGAGCGRVTDIKQGMCAMSVPIQ
jgi:hypothetical protein